MTSKQDMYIFFIKLSIVFCTYLYMYVCVCLCVSNDYNWGIFWTFCLLKNNHTNRIFCIFPPVGLLCRWFIYLFIFSLVIAKIIVETDSFQQKLLRVTSQFSTWISGYGEWNLKLQIKPLLLVNNLRRFLKAYLDKGRSNTNLRCHKWIGIC